VGADPGPGVLHQLSGVIAHEQGNILSIEIVEEKSPETVTYFEIDVPGDPELLLEGLRRLPVVHRVTQVQTMQKVFGKRIIIVGGGAQVGQVALGAITEADRHNIRGERISVDTIPLVGEEALASAVRAVVRLPRVRLLVACLRRSFAARRSPKSSSSWLPVSTTEWIASLSMAALPVNPAAANLVSAMAVLPASCS